MGQQKIGLHAASIMIVTLVTTLLFGGVNAGASGNQAVSMKNYPSLLDATLEKLHAGLKDFSFSSVNLVDAYVKRIEELNSTLHAVTEINPDAWKIAGDLDFMIGAGLFRGPLHGIPILLKGNIATNDSLQTTAGSFALWGAKTAAEATIVEKLRDNGAVILGKTTMSEWAHWRSANTTNGWAPHGGQVIGGYYLEADPWGSSSGSGVAASLGMAFAAIGTETDGSIITPAEVNNIVGIKPSVGFTSRHLVVPVSEHQDTIGPMARTVKDAAQILQVIAGPDPKDNYTSAIPNGEVPDFVAACKPDALKGMRLGLPLNVLALHAKEEHLEIVEALDKALAVMIDAGATIVQDPIFSGAEELQNYSLPAMVLNADFKTNIKRYLAHLTHNPNNLTSLEDIRAFTQTDPREEYPERDTDLWDDALRNWDNTDPRFWQAYQENRALNAERGLLGALEKHNLDAIVLPTRWASSYAATVGAPVVTVPMGAFSEAAPVTKDAWGLVETAPGIPFGVSFLGKNFDDAKLIGMAYAFERRTRVREKVKPYMVPKTELADVVPGARERELKG